MSFDNFIQSAEEFLTNMIKGMQVSLWGPFEWMVVFITSFAVLKVLVSSITTVVKAALLIAAVIFLGIYFGYINV